MLDLRVNELFFDRQAVISAVSKAKRSALNRIGAFVRLTAKRSIRPRKGPSAPGKPPHSHTGLLRDHIYYSFDQLRESVVIGPALLRTRRSGEPVDATIPQVLEKSGEIRRKRKRSDRVEIIKIAARPYMAPAFEAGQRSGKLAEFWRNVGRG